MISLQGNTTLEAKHDSRIYLTQHLQSYWWCFRHVASDPRPRLNTSDRPTVTTMMSRFKQRTETIAWWCFLMACLLFLTSAVSVTTEMSTVTHMTTPTYFTSLAHMTSAGVMTSSRVTTERTSGVSVSNIIVNRRSDPSEVHRLGKCRVPTALSFSKLSLCVTESCELCLFFIAIFDTVTHVPLCWWL